MIKKILLTSSSGIIYNLKSLIKLDSEYDLYEIYNKLRTKNVTIREFTLENKIQESIIVHPKYIKFISNNTNIKLFHNEEIIILM